MHGEMEVEKMYLHSRAGLRNVVALFSKTVGGPRITQIDTNF